MKIFVVRSVLFFAAVYCFIAANYNNTNSNLLGDNTVYSLPPIAKYVTPNGTGDHSGSSWSNAYSIEDFKMNAASNTNYYFSASVFYTGDINLNNLNNSALIGSVLGTPEIPTTIFVGGGEISDTLNWSLNCIDLNNSFNITIKNIQIKKYRWFGLRVNSTSGGFIGDNTRTDTSGWAAWGAPIGPPHQEILSPGGIKLFGDNATLRNSNIRNSGWDGVQVAGYNVLIESSSIDSTGIDLPGAEHQGDGIHVFRNPDIYYEQESGLRIYKAGRLTVNNCYVSTNFPKKSGIEAGFIDGAVEKPRLRVYNSYIAGGKGIGITQSNDLANGEFYSDVQNCTIVGLDPTRRPFRIEFYDSGTKGIINSNIFICQVGFDTTQCPVGEYDTAPTAVKYGTNTWKIGTEWQDPFCVDHNLVYVED